MKQEKKKKQKRDSSNTMKKVINLRMRNEQYTKMCEMAAKYGYTNLSEYIRRTALGEQKVEKQESK